MINSCSGRYPPPQLHCASSELYKGIVNENGQKGAIAILYAIAIEKDMWRSVQGCGGNIGNPWFKHLDTVGLRGIFDHGSSCCGLLELCFLSYFTFQASRRHNTERGVDLGLGILKTNEATCISTINEPLSKIIRLLLVQAMRVNKHFRWHLQRHEKH